MKIQKKECKIFLISKIIYIFKYISLLVGYNYEARIFEDIDELINHLNIKQDNIKNNDNNPYW